MSIDQKSIEIVLASIRELLAVGNLDEAVALLNDLRLPDQAEVFSDLSTDEQVNILPYLEPGSSADILEELEDEEVLDLAVRLEPTQLLPILENMEPDEAADLLGDINPEQASELLDWMSEAEEVRPLLAHEDETAGGVMTSVSIVLHVKMTVQEAIEHLRRQSPDSEDVYYLFVLDEWTRVVGVVSLRQLVVSPPDAVIGDIMDKDVIHITADADQEEAARLMFKYDLLALPVLDSEGRLLGLITYDDSLDVLEDEATEDIYRLGGVPSGQPADVRIPAAMRSRLPWLVLNMGTAMVSAFVLSLFESTIASVAALTAFFPIVAGVSGSAGTQTLTVTVRGIALGEINRADGLKTLGRELLIGLVNGLVLGLVVAGIALVWKKTPMLGLVIGAATMLNLITAGIAGVLVPMGFNALKIDPALASPILVTTTTDTLGYFFYLGLATILIIYLL